MQQQKCGWKMGEYAELVGIGRSKLYTLPPEQQPRSVNVGARRVVIEPPVAYLERLAAQQRSAA